MRRCELNAKNEEARDETWRWRGDERTKKTNRKKEDLSGIPHAIFLTRRSHENESLHIVTARK